MNFTLVTLLIAAFGVAQVLIGGTRMLYSIPACVLLALAGLISVGSRWKGESTARAGCLWATIVFAVYILARDQASPIHYLARPDFLIAGGALVVYLVTALLLPRASHRLPVIFALLTLGLANAVIGAIQFKRGDQFMLLPWIHRTDNWWRASGFYISPNHYAGFLEVVALVTLSLVCWANLRLLFKIALGYVAAICMVGLALSGSRGGYLSLAFGLMVFAILSVITLRKVSPGRVLPKVLIALAVLVVCGAAGGLLAQKSGAIYGRIRGINDPENMRFMLWPTAVEQFTTAPVWGTGSGTFLYYGRMFRDARVQNDPIYVHNDYLHLLAEYGSVGAVAFLLFLGMHVVAGVGNVRLLADRRSYEGVAPANQLALQIGAVSAIGAYAFHSLVDFNVHIPANAFLIAFMFGMVANPATGQGSAMGRVTAVTIRGLLAGMAVVLLAFALPKFPGEWFAEKARVALRDRHLEEARAMAIKALEHEKRNPDIYFYAGEATREMVAQKMADPALRAEAIEWFRAGLTQFPQDVRFFLKLGQTFDEMHQFEAAEDQLDAAAELDPNNSIVYSYYGLHYHMQGLLPDAEEQYDLALELDPTNAMARAGKDAITKVLGPARDQRPALEPTAMTPEERAEVEAEEAADAAARASSTPLQ